MRVHRTLCSAFRFGMMTAVATGITLAASPALAGDVEQGGATGDGSPNSSRGTAAFKYEHAKALPTSITTPPLGPSWAKMTVGLAIEPVQGAGPLFSVDMPKGAVLDASWGNDKKILLKAVSGAQTDGTVKVRHTLAPSIKLEIDKWGFKAGLNYDANALLNKLPGARFEYDSQATQQFAPWGFTAVDTKLSSPNLDQSQLFQMDFYQLPEFVSQNADGYFGVRAVTKPTFSYKTTKVILQGAPGAITTGTGELSIPAIDGDFMEVTSAVEGEMTVKGEVSVHPFVHVDRVGDYTISADIGYDVYSAPFETPPARVAFQSAVVHLPLPNVHVPDRGVDLGEVKSGKSVSRKVTIENSGEKDAVLSFKSTDHAFSVPQESVAVPSKGSYELVVKYSPDSAEPAAADITVLSNDPDSPEQKFKIGANGADVGPSSDDGLPKAGDGDGGCGCKAAGSHSSVPSWAGFGALGLGAVSLLRRRRKQG
jgi:MYXO-CTERM domain-containing protein